MAKRKATEDARLDSDYSSFTVAPRQSTVTSNIPDNVNHVSPKIDRPIGIMSSPFKMFGSSGGPSITALEKKPTELLNQEKGKSSSPSPASSLEIDPEAKAAEKAKAMKLLDEGFVKINTAYLAAVRRNVRANPNRSLCELAREYLHKTRIMMHNIPRQLVGVKPMTESELPANSFKSLGEFFEDFEQTYVLPSLEKLPNASINTPQSPSKPTACYYGLKSDHILNFNASSNNESLSKNSITSIPSSQRESLSIPTPLSGSSSSLTNSEVKTSSNYIDKGFVSLQKQTTSECEAQQSKSAAVAADTTSFLDNIKPSKPHPFANFSFFGSPSPSQGNNSSLSNFKPKPVCATSLETIEEVDKEEDEEPPKEEITPVTEDDFVYSIRCKVFVHENHKLKDKGIGTLYVKKIEGGKYQVVVRGENNLGTILLNILLQKSLPITKNQKNSVMTMDLQESKDGKKAAPVFIKVKTEQEATELLNKLKEYQAAS